MSGELERLSQVQTLTPVALALGEGLTYEQWEAVGADLARVSTGVMWWLGDWWAYGQEHGYDGEWLKRTVDSTLAASTWRNAGTVARKFEPARRRESLPWSFHAEVAALEPRQQDALLDAAEAEGWTQRELRSAVRDTRRQDKVDEIVRDHQPSLDGLGP